MSVVWNPFTGNFDFTGSGGGSPTTPGGANTSVQFNNGGSFGGFGTWDGSALVVPGTGQVTGLGIGTAGVSGQLTLEGPEPIVWEVTGAGVVAVGDAEFFKIQDFPITKTPFAFNTTLETLNVGTGGAITLDGVNAAMYAGNLTLDGGTARSLDGVALLTRATGDMTIQTTGSGKIALIPADGTVEVTGSVSASAYTANSLPGFTGTISAADLTTQDINVEGGIITGLV